VGWWWLLPIALIGSCVSVFNRPVSDRNLVAQGCADLVPRLVEAVRGHAAYERAALEALVSLRARLPEDQSKR